MFLNKLTKFVFFFFVLGGLLIYFVSNQNKLPSRSIEVIPDKDTCHYCRMHISDLRFACQIQYQNHEILFFDDPGCLFLEMNERSIASKDNSIHAIYFRHFDRSEWIPAKHSLFIPVKESPMGYNMAAVSKGFNTTNIDALTSTSINQDVISYEKMQEYFLSKKKE